MKTSTALSLRTLYVVLPALLVCLLYQPVLAQSVSVQSGTNINFTNKGKHTYIHEEDDYSLKVELEGEIRFTEDDKGVAYISEGGELEVEEEKNGTKHFVRIEGLADGEVVHTYRINGRRAEFEDGGRAWLAATLPDVIRQTGIGAEQRVARILKQGGVGAVLDEIENIRSNSAKKRYFSHLFAQADLSTAELKRAAGIARAMSSSGDKKRFLINHADAYFADSATYAAYFDVAGTIDSSGDRKRVLMHLAEAGYLKDADAHRAALDLTMGIPSSGDKSRVLRALAPMAVANANVRGRYFEAAASISSSGDKARVLKAVLELDRLDEATLMQVIRTARTISSSGDKARVLIAAADRVAGNDALVDAYLEAANSIGSSGDQQRALSALMR